MKILLLSLSTGSGHVRAADAILKTIQQQYPQIDAEHIDVFHYLSNPFKRGTVDAYDLLIKTSPELWGLLFKHSDNAKLLALAHKYSKKIKRFNSKKLQAYLKAYNPTHIISTHFFCTDMYLSAKEKYGYNASISTVITDYCLHELWILPGTNHYFVPTQNIKKQMIARGVTAKKNITVSGIPVDPIFYTMNKKKTGKDKKTNILVMFGGQGLGHADKIVKSLLNSQDSNISITAIAGKNKKLKKKLERIHDSRLSVVGWTNKIHTHMHDADVIISKPGGMTTTECITLGKPFIAIDPIPGQEEANAQYIKKHNYGYIAKHPKELPELIKQATTKHPPRKTQHAGKIIIEKTQNKNS